METLKDGFHMHCTFFPRPNAHARFPKMSSFVPFLIPASFPLKWQILKGCSGWQMKGGRGLWIIDHDRSTADYHYYH